MGEKQYYTHFFLNTGISTVNRCSIPHNSAHIHDKKNQAKREENFLNLIKKKTAKTNFNDDKEAHNHIYSILNGSPKKVKKNRKNEF